MAEQTVVDRVAHIVSNGATPSEKRRGVEGELRTRVLSASEVLDVRDILTTVAGWPATDAKALIDAAQKHAKRSKMAPAVVADPMTWPYVVEDGRLKIVAERQRGGGDITLQAEAVADFHARIVEEGRTETGGITYTLEGASVRGGEFSVDVTAEEMSKPQALKALLTAACGGRDAVAAKQEVHLEPAIRKLTQEIRRVKRFTRTGWHEGKFLLPGREAEGTTIRLPRKLAYGVNPDAEFDKGLMALDALIDFMGAEVATPLLSALFLAPMAGLADWGNYRSGVFVSGRTGKGKTSSTQVAMCLYGAGFALDDNLIGWGLSATPKAVMGFATSANDMTVLIDNYKPQTGAGAEQLVSVIHAFLEGSDRDRQSRDGVNKEASRIHAYMLATGEDFPQVDAATAARVLVLEFAGSEKFDRLTVAQELSCHLPALGLSWIEWLETREGQEAVRRVASEFVATRKAWTDYLTTTTGQQTHRRIAENLATNQLCWLALCEHPALGEWAKRHVNAHTEALQSVGATMAARTKQASEAARWLDALRDCLSGGRVLVLGTPQATIDSLSPDEQRRFVGWREGEDLYLLPSLTHQALKKETGLDLHGMSEIALYRQLDEAGVIFDKGKDFTAKQKWLGGKNQRVLCVKMPNLLGIVLEKNS